MMKRNIYTLFLFLFTLTFITACSDDDDPEPETTTDLLVAHEWRGDQVLIAGLDVSNNQEVRSRIGDIETVRLTFKQDGTYTATFNTSAGPQTQTGTWTLNEDETMLEFDLLGEAEIETLTDNSLNLTTELPYQGLTFDAEVKFVK